MSDEEDPMLSTGMRKAVSATRRAAGTKVGVAMIISICSAIGGKAYEAWQNQVTMGVQLVGLQMQVTRIEAGMNTRLDRAEDMILKNQRDLLYITRAIDATPVQQGH